MADFGDASKAGVDPELQEFLLIEKQKAQVNAQVTSLLSSFLSLMIATYISLISFSVDSRICRSLLGQMYREARKQS